MRWAGGLAVACSLLLGTAHAEAPPMRIELNIFGQPDLYRFGVKQDYWFWTGTGLKDAFKGVPEAEYLAERYQFFSTTGNVSSIVGTAAVVGGLWYRLDHEYKRKDHPTSWWIIIGGGVVSSAGTAMAVFAPRLIYQAVNVFNERYEPEMLPEFHMQMTDLGQPDYRVLWTVRP